MDDALERAMNLFWERGYEATSMSDLVEHLGISRQSLYDTFGDKHAIYTAALERFRAGECSAVRTLLTSDEPIRGVLRRLFEKLIDQDLSGTCARGCMLVNAAVELSSSDQAVGKILCDNARALEALFTARLQKAQDRGEIGAHHDPVALGRFFMTVISGLRVASKTTRDRRALEDVARVALAVLG